MERQFKRVPTTEPDAKKASSSEDIDTLCGIGSFKPSWLQRFADPKVYLVIFCIVGVLQGAYFTYFVGVLSTLEKRFAFESKISGIILIADNISGTFISLLVGYYGGKGHKPRMIAFGMIIVSVSSILSALPYFIYGPALHLLSRDSSEFGFKEQEYCGIEPTDEKCENAKSSSMVLAVTILFIANFLNGFGYTAYYTIGTPYLDDNVKKKNSPMYFSRYNQGVDSEYDSSLDVTDIGKRMQQTGKDGVTCEEQVQGVSPDWSELPSMALEQIYLCLNREDQSRMSLVCRNWSAEYNNPRLWRKFRFHVVSDTINPDIISSRVRFAEKFSKMFHHLEIEFDSSIYHRPLSKTAVEQLRHFFIIVTFRSQLVSISFIRCRFSTAYVAPLFCDPRLLGNVFSAVINLLQNQRQLKSVVFQSAFFDIEQGMKVLRSIFFEKELCTLNLENFILDRFNSCDEIEPLILVGFVNLQEVTLDYTHCFDKIIKTCSYSSNPQYLQERRGTLKKMKLFCGGSDLAIFNGIRSETWNIFRNICPSLKIDLTYDTGISLIRNDIELFLVRNIPIRAFKFHEGNYNIDLGLLFSHLVSCDIDRSIEELSLIGIQRGTDLNPDLISFLQSCPILKTMRLGLKHPVNGLCSVFNSWLESGCMSLESVHITVVVYSRIRHVSNRTNRIYTNLAEEYVPLLRGIGLSLILSVDPR